MSSNYQSIRVFANTGLGASVVVLVHPWKGCWSRVFCEDMYGTSPDVLEMASVGEAKAAAKAVVKKLNKEGGCVKYIDVIAYRQTAQEAVAAFAAEKNLLGQQLQEEIKAAEAYASHVGELERKERLRWYEALPCPACGGPCKTVGPVSRRTIGPREDPIGVSIRVRRCVDCRRQWSTVRDSWPPHPEEENNASSAERKVLLRAEKRLGGDQPEWVETISMVADPSVRIGGWEYFPRLYAALKGGKSLEAPSEDCNRPPSEMDDPKNGIND